jgi:hypothetical protein
MKNQITLKLILINVVPIIFLLFNISELYNVFYGNSDYSFGSDFFSAYSIYQSKMWYIIYLSIFIVSLLGMISFSKTNKRVGYYALLIVNVLLFLYPMCTN